MNYFYKESRSKKKLGGGGGAGGRGIAGAIGSDFLTKNPKLI